MQAALSPQPFEQIKIKGDLLKRLTANYDRLERPPYTLDKLYGTEASPDWPGDTVGRTILAWSYLARATDREPKILHSVYQALPQHLNARGYMGPAFTDLDEQQLSGHGWLASGLIAYYEYSKDESALEAARRMVDGLFMPMHGKLAVYPKGKEDRQEAGLYAGSRVNSLKGWTLSTDVGCAFISLEGLVKAYQVFRRAEEKALIEEMFVTFCEFDLLAVSAQLHASLTATRQFLLFYNLAPDDAFLEQAIKVYGLFRQFAITENYANYNWFGRPTWTEPCAVVDAFICAVELWRHTGDPEYMNDAHHIYFNALGYGQKPHGGFGCDDCAGVATPVLANQVFDVTWCCNMRGGVGLSRVVQYTYWTDGNSLYVPFYFDSTAEIKLSGGWLTIDQSSHYPHEGQVKLSIVDVKHDLPVELCLFIPSWVNTNTVVVIINGLAAPFKIDKGFARIDQRVYRQADQVELSFPIQIRKESTLNPSNVPGWVSYRQGALVLGRTLPVGNSPVDTMGTANQVDLHLLEPLNEVFNLDNQIAQKDRRQVLFGE